jgi:N-acetylmuramoyl-L-alanine amidase
LIAAPDTPLATAVAPSPNFGARRADMEPSILLLHYTGLESCSKAIDWLSRPGSKVSCHYVIDLDGRITQMVEEKMRAWHAGNSFWAGERDINSAAIGIEIHNPGQAFGYPDFPDAQIAAVEALCRDIIARHGIRPERVLAHSDVAPARKTDPGEKFPWDRLARAGIGHWVAPEPLKKDDHGIEPGDCSPTAKRAMAMLERYGYDVASSDNMDRQAQFVVRAFQRHFRPGRVDGRMDRSTFATLERLLAALAHNSKI